MPDDIMLIACTAIGTKTNLAGKEIR